MDRQMDQEYDVVYTYNNIPAECMRLVDVLNPEQLLKFYN